MSENNIRTAGERGGVLRRRIIWGAGVLAVAALGFLIMRPNPLPVDVAAATRGPMVVTIEEDGRTRVKDRFAISAPTTGNLVRLELNPGERVEAGQPLAFIGPAASPLLDSRTLDEARARLAAAQAALEQSHAGIALAEAATSMAEEDVARQRVMLDLGTGTPYRLRQAELQYKAKDEELNSARFAAEVAAHQVESARSTLRQLDSGGRATEEVAVTSPVAGRVLRVLHESGGLVQAGTPLLEVGDPSTLEVVVDVLTADAVRITPGCHAALTRWGGNRVIEGAVHVVEPSAFTKVSALGVEEQRVNVVVDLVDGADWSALGDGYQVDVAIEVWRGTVLHVPSGAVFPQDEGWAVYTLQAGRAELRPVEVGERSADYVEIASGLSEEDVVLVYPSDSVRDGVRVEATT